MSDEMESRFLEAEQYIRNQKYKEAAEILQELKKSEEAVGRAEFDLGNIALMQGEFEKAFFGYEASLEKGYDIYLVYQNMAQIKEKQGEIKQAEKLLKKALEKVSGQKEEAIALYMNCLFYYRNEMMLKAEKAARKLTQILPENYQGHHLLVLIWQKKEDYDSAEQYLERIQGQFEMHVQYFLDKMSLLEKQGKYEEGLQMLDNDSFIMKVIPEEVLLKKLKLLLRLERKEEGRKIIQELFLGYGNANAAFSSMVLAMADGKYMEAGNIAYTILKSEGESGNPGFLYYLTLFVHIFILDMALAGKPTEEVTELMKKEADICVPWLKRIGISEEELKNALKLVFV